MVVVEVTVVVTVTVFPGNVMMDMAVVVVVSVVGEISTLTSVV